MTLFLTNIFAISNSLKHIPIIINMKEIEDLVKCDSPVDYSIKN